MSELKNDNLSGRNEGDIYPNLPLRYLTASSMIGEKVRNDKDKL